MIVSNKNQVSEIQVNGTDVKDVFKKVLLSPKEGWAGNVMRVFKIKSGGNTPKHEHPWFHVNYVLKGKGTLYLDGASYVIEEGAFAYVPAGKVHQFSNTSTEDLEFICIVPEEGEN